MSSSFRLQLNEDRNNVIYRKVRGILNKITPEKFDKLSKELVGLGLNSKVILKGVILLIYEKALEEPKYSSMYAQLCKKLSEEVPNFDNNSSLLDPQNPHANSTFHRLLLFKCRDEFENRFKAAEAFGDGPLSPEDEEQKSLAKYKMLGNIKFICELGKQRLVQETILHSCIHQLCRKKVSETIQSKVEDLECLCQIMKTIGCLLDTPEAKPLMDQYFDRMEKFSQNGALPSRIRFMLQDVLELRNNKWVPRRIHREQNPKTIIQIRAEAAKDFGYSNPQPNHVGGNSNIYPLSYFNNFTMPLRQSHFGSGPNQVLLGHVQAGQRALDDLYSSPLTPYGLNNPLANPNLTGYKFISQQPPNHNLFDTNRGNLNVLHQHQQQQHHHHQQAHQHSHHQQSLGVGSSGNNRELPPRFQRMAMHQNNQHHLNPSSKNQIQSNIQINSSLQRAIQGGPISSPVMNPNSLDPRQQVSQNKPFLPTPDHFNSSDGGEISLRPAQNSIMHKHNMALKNKPQSNMTNNPMINMNSSSNPKIVDPHFPSYQMPNVGKNNKANSEIQANIRNKNQTNKATIIKNTDEALKNYMGGKSEIDILIKGIADLDIPKNFQSEVIVSMIKKTLDGSESDRESVSTIISKMNVDKIFSTNVFLTAFKDLLNVMADLEISIPRVKSHVAGFLARAIVDEIISLKDVYEMVEGGQYYPLLLLCLQNLHQTKGQQWLSENFNQRKVNLMLTLPEIDRVKERLADILRERDLSFLEPLLRIEFDMTKFLSGSDLSPNSLYSWIQGNVDPGLRNTPGFINVLFTCSAKFITERAKQAASDATFNEGDATAGPTNIREHEKDLLSKYAFVFNAFLRDKPNLQLVLLYSLQSYWFGQGCPKEMLLRWFVLLYDLEIVEDDVFFKWKEDINDEYPGKQQALFQVNKWFDWLEKADDDDEEEEEGSDSVSK